MVKGDLNQALKYAELAVEKAPTHADRVWAQGVLGWVWCRSGEPHRGLEALAKAFSISKAGRFRWGEAGYSMMLGEGYFLAGEYD